jgi:hypothetical protein
MRDRDLIRSLSLPVWVLLLAGGACGSSAPAPIPDPGGPFHTNVSANKTLGSLTSDETLELCNDLHAADGTFLVRAYATQVTCLLNGYAAASLVDAGTGSVDSGTANAADAGFGQVDGGAANGTIYQRACQSEYDSCVATLMNGGDLFSCPLPAPGCSASVELLSACLNEVAAADPISLCTGTEGCSAASAVEAVLPTPPKSASLPPTPACARLTQECPTVYVELPCAAP